MDQKPVPSQNNEPDNSAFFANENITTEPYTGSGLKSVGIIHATGSAGSNAIREVGTGLFRATRILNAELFNKKIRALPPKRRIN